MVLLKVDLDKKRFKYFTFIHIKSNSAPSYDTLDDHIPFEENIIKSTNLKKCVKMRSLYDEIYDKLKELEIYEDSDKIEALSKQLVEIVSK